MNAAVQPRSPAGRRRSDRDESEHHRGVAVDFDRRLIALGGIERELRRWRTRSAVVPTYLDLVMQARGRGPASHLPVRSADLLALGSALAVPVGSVQIRLRSALVRSMTGRPKLVLNRAILPAAGVVTVAGAGSMAYSNARSDGGTSPMAVADESATSQTAPLEEPTPVAVPGDPARQPAAAADAARDRSTEPSSEGSAQTPPQGAAASAPDVLATPLTPEAEVGRQALELLTYDWRSQLPGWQVAFLPGRDGLLGYAYFDQRRIEIYVRDTHSVEDVAATIAHELGHAVDITYLTTEERDLWLAERGIAADWWPNETNSDYSSGAGDWAEAFAVWQVGDITRSRVAGQPTSTQLELLEALAAD